VDFIVKDPDREKEMALTPSGEVLNTIVLREYGIDLSRVKR
jgi:hypothetical protein